MITWFEAPKEGLSPGGKIEFQTLTATENKTYSEDGVAYTSVTVNVEGGGGSSDFSTAEVTIKAGESSIDGYLDYLPILESDGLITTSELVLEAQEQITKTIVLYKGKTTVGGIGPYTIDSMSGNITIDDDDYYIITGDCSVTLLPED